MTSPQSLAVGLIGAERMGSFHAETLARRLPGVRLAAIADPAPGATEALAERLDCPKAYTEIGDLLTDPEIDAAVIVTPARTHAGLVEAAARAGKAVFCEKPMAVTLDEADRAVAAAREAGVALQVGITSEDARAAPGMALATGAPVRVGDARKVPARQEPSRRR
ncbi:hypothetical protein GCM10022403_045830 [Streptomyces coacervatus]|uniref:Gfo/Idh/MocA-like oxidoreductase N-terminal domain-containing protein n=1 Tax=Streptomyces coacervatus TaxID=647381 RepID=A0ABP7I079_9ACTN|nr:Gfo/Idh/MocA family oxidoreductase [Streptomyces coacervatus]MDF2269529.1 Gfo/Idh/MocA family oxidoreductase [Streptomyces coacervatus]